MLINQFFKQKFRIFSGPSSSNLPDFSDLSVVEVLEYKHVNLQTPTLHWGPIRGALSPDRRPGGCSEVWVTKSKPLRFIVGAGKWIRSNYCQNINFLKDIT